MTEPFPPFESFFRAFNSGRDPFPWQGRLAARVADRGWPPSIGVHTGLGKTACLDIAIWALARQATLAPQRRTAATRIWYVVNRRLLVDAAHDHGVLLREVLAAPTTLPEHWNGATHADIEVVAAVGRALQSMVALKSEAGPLHVVRLRGGAELGVRPPDPSQPTLIFATLPMYGSRLLFRGYGVSTLMRPVDAALAGMDSLVLLDEAHLARPLVQMCEQAAACDVGDPSTVLVPQRARPFLVALTATGGPTDDQFDLDDEDRRHPVISRRLNAVKSLMLVETTGRDLVRTLSQEALALCSSQPGSACVVFCNTARAARAVKDCIDAQARIHRVAAHTTLLTGRMREREAARIRSEVTDRDCGAPSGRDPHRRRAQPLIVVATQTLEVGADLDFDFLVTETASVRAMIQRLGRLNRLGDRPWARAVICHPAESQTIVPYGVEPVRVWERLQTASVDDRGLCPDSISTILGEPADEPPRTGELLPDHLWELAKTSQSERHEPPPDVFFDALDDAVRRVSLCWRAYLPPKDGQPLLPALRQDEAIDVPIGEARDALRGRGVQSVRRLDREEACLQTVSVDALLPGDQIVLPTDIGMYDQHGWSPGSKEAVLDVSLGAAGLMWLERTAIERMVRPGEEGLDTVGELLDRLDGSEEPDPEADADTAREVVALLRAMEPHSWLEEGEWSAYLDRVDTGQVLRDVAESAPYLKMPSARRRGVSVGIRADVFDGLTFDVTSAALADHQASVSGAAVMIAEKLGMPERLVSAMQMAGLAHDLGKADDRFQRWLDPEGRFPEVQAKSNTPFDQREGTRVASGWPRGGRHETISARFVAEWLADHKLSSCEPDLVQHLVAAHHGHGRPLVPGADDGELTLVVAEFSGVKLVVDGNLAAIDWGQPRRFRALCERHGFWGLSLLEAVLRQADHMLSGRVEVA